MAFGEFLPTILNTLHEIEIDRVSFVKHAIGHVATGIVSTVSLFVQTCCMRSLSLSLSLFLSISHDRVRARRTSQTLTHASIYSHSPLHALQSRKAMFDVTRAKIDQVQSDHIATCVVKERVPPPPDFSHVNWDELLDEDVRDTTHCIAMPHDALLT